MTMHSLDGPTSVIAGEDLTKRFGATVALDGLSVAVGRGEVVEIGRAHV